MPDLRRTSNSSKYEVVTDEIAKRKRMQELDVVAKGVRCEGELKYFYDTYTGEQGSIDCDCENVNGITYASHCRFASSEASEGGRHLPPMVRSDSEGRGV